MEPLLKSLEPRSGFRVQASPSVVVRALCKSRKPPKPETRRQRQTSTARKVDFQFAHHRSANELIGLGVQGFRV